MQIVNRPRKEGPSKSVMLQSHDKSGLPASHSYEGPSFLGLTLLSIFISPLEQCALMMYESRKAQKKNSIHTFLNSLEMCGYWCINEWTKLFMWVHESNKLTLWTNEVELCVKKLFSPMQRKSSHKSFKFNAQIQIIRGQKKNEFHNSCHVNLGFLSIKFERCSLVDCTGW